MEQLRGLPLGRQIVLGAGVLLLIDTFLDWQQVSILGTSVGNTAWHGFWGVLMCIALLALLAWLALTVAGVKIALPVSDTLIAAGLAAIVLVFAVIKNLADDYSTKWSYLGIVFAAVIAVGACLQVKAAGGIEKLRSEMSSATSATARPHARPAAHAAAEPAPSKAAPAEVPPASTDQA